MPRDRRIFDGEPVKLSLRRLTRTILLTISAVFLVFTARATAQQTAAGATDPSILLQAAKQKMLSDPQQAGKIAATAENILKARSPSEAASELVATAEWLQGEALVRLGKPDQATPILADAWDRIKNQTTPTKLKGDLLLSRGGAAVANANVSAALADYQNAYKTFRQVKETRSEAIALLSIASLYREANDTGNALKYYSQALDVYKGDPLLQVSIHNNLGNTLTEQEEFSKAQREFDMALAIARKMNSSVLEAQIIRNIARLQLDSGARSQAEKTIRAGLALASNMQEPSWRSQFLAIAARASYENGDLNQAAALIREAFADVDVSDDALALRDAHETAYEVYKKLGRSDLALQHLEALKRLDDQTASLAASANTALMAARFDYTNQNLKIAQLQAQDLRRKITYERAHARTVRIAFVAAGGTTLVIIGMLVFGIITIRRSRNEVRAANIGLEATNAALAKALAAKTEFLATTSHEIRTPLNGILGMTQVMLADRSLPASAHDRLSVVHSAGVTMRALVDDILDVAKMETGNMTIERAPMDVCAVLRDVARVWEDQARARGLDFVLSLDGCPAIVEGDAARLRQVVFNLLSNALKFTEAGTITLHGAASHGEGDSRVRISVSDTGIGIAPDKQEEIFESFKQADTSTTRRFGGTGLGLAICRNLARGMGGDATVSSVPGEGATFTIDLPLIEAAVDTGCVVSEIRTDALLIVDRNPISRSMLRALFEERAGAVEFAGTLDEAAIRVAKGGIDRVLIDDGTARACDDLPAALTALAAARPGVPIALLWAQSDPETTQALLATGIDRLIAKPIAGPDLREALYPADAGNATNRGDRTDPHLVPNAA